MSIRESDILAYVGGAALLKHGTLTRRLTTIGRGGEEAKEVWTRAGGGALQRTRAGLYVAAGANVPRIERLDLDNDGIFETPAVLIEDSRINRVENSDVETDLVGVVAVAATVTRDSVHAVSGSWGVKVVSTNAGDSGVQWTKRDTTRIAAVAGTAYTWTCPVYADATFGLGAVLKLRLDWYDAGGGFLSSTQVAQSALVTGWQLLRTTATAPASTAFVVPFLVTNSAQGTITWWTDCPTFEAGAFGSNPIPTTGGTVTRNADSCGGFPFYAAPQAIAIYLKFIHRGGDYPMGVFEIGDAADALVNDLSIHYSNAGAAPNQPFRINGAVAASPGVTRTLAAAPVVGETIELIGLQYSDASVELQQSRNGAALTTTGRSSAPASGLPATYGGPLWIGARGTQTPGYNPFIAAIVVRAPNNVFPSLADFQALLPPVGASYS